MPAKVQANGFSGGFEVEDGNFIESVPVQPETPVEPEKPEKPEKPVRVKRTQISVATFQQETPVDAAAEIGYDTAPTEKYQWLWWMIVMLIFIIILFLGKYHVVLVSIDEDGNEDRACKFRTWFFNDASTYLKEHFENLQVRSSAVEIRHIWRKSGKKFNILSGYKESHHFGRLFVSRKKVCRYAQNYKGRTGGYKISRWSNSKNFCCFVIGSCSCPLFQRRARAARNIIKEDKKYEKFKIVSM